MATNILLTDKLGSPLGASTVPRQCFTPYGYHRKPTPLQTGFAGERLDEVAGFYHLGQGHRSYAPALMRFHSSDDRSPFADGGLNSYAYCTNDPVNYTDPSGRGPRPVAAIGPRMPSTPAPSLSPGGLAQHYTARVLTGGGSTAGAAIEFLALAGENHRWLAANPGQRRPMLDRLIDITGFYGLLLPGAGDVIEMFLPPAAASRAGLIDFLSVGGGTAFTTAAGLRTVRGLRAHGTEFFRMDWPSIRYTARELTLIGPVVDLAGDFYRMVSNRNRSVGNASRDIPMTVASAALPAISTTARQIRRSSV